MFINVTKKLNIKPLIINITDDIHSLTKNYENHISIRKINEAFHEKDQTVSISVSG